MKPKIAALGLLTAASLFADECCPPASCPPCEPCCVPQPKKCIDCECYTPAFYDLQCDWGAFFDIEFLYWYARESDLSYAVKGQTVSRGDVLPGPLLDLIFTPKSFKYIETSWDPGVRVGLGWNDSCDGWDYYLNWTYFHNSSRSSVSATFEGLPADNTVFAPANPNVPALGEFAILNPYINPAFLLSNPQLFDKVIGKWKLTYNSIDLEVGRKYWLSQCFNLRPYAGLRGSWIKLRFRTRSLRNITTPETTNPPTIDALYKDRFTTRRWGVGFLGGLQPTWYWCSNFALYANVDAALVWGDGREKKRENYTDSGAQLISYKNRWSAQHYQMYAMLDTALGLRWEETWCCDRYRTNFDIGWEHHIWFDTNQRKKLIDNFSQNGVTGSGITGNVLGFRSYVEEAGNLGFGGLVIRLRFDF